MTTGLDALDPLVDLLTATELRRVAASLDAIGRARRAAREVRGENEATAAALLAELVPLFGLPAALAAALRTVARALDERPSPPELVWSGPQLSGDSIRTTEALERLVDEAEESVLASTYSGSAAAPFVQALHRAAARKLTITVIADVVNQGACARDIARKVPRARVLGYHYLDGTKSGLQHSKVLVIDGRTSLVTSANLSFAAVERNLETGLLTNDLTVASDIARRMADLEESGHLRPIGPSA